MSLLAPITPRPARPRRAARLRRLICSGGVAGSAMLTACDPCAGVVGCTESPRLGVSGQIVDRGDPTDAYRSEPSGTNIPATQPVAGVRVEVTPTGGVATDAASAVSTTGSDGFWQVSIPARDEGAVTADVVVTAPDGSSYAVRGLTLRTSRTRGNGNVLGRWTHRLYMTELGEVITWPNGERAVGTRVTPVRRGGIEVAPTRNTIVPILTVGDGRFLYDVRPLADGPLQLDFVVEREGLPPTTVRDVTIYPRHEWLPPNSDNPSVIFRLDSAGARH